MTSAQYRLAVEQLHSLVKMRPGAEIKESLLMTRAWVVIPRTEWASFADWVPDIAQVGRVTVERVGPGVLEVAVTVMDEEAMSNIGTRLAEMPTVAQEGI